MGAVHRRGCLTLQAADEPLRWASGRPRGEGRGPVAPPVFKTGLSLLVGDGRFDSFPSPPAFVRQGLTPLCAERSRLPSDVFGASFPHLFPIRRAAVRKMTPWVPAEPGVAS